MKKFLVIFSIFLFGYISNIKADTIVVGTPVMQSFVAMVTQGIPSYNIYSIIDKESPHHIHLTFKQKESLEKAKLIFIFSKSLEGDIYNNVSKGNRSKIIILDSYKQKLKLYPVDSKTFSVKDNHKHAHNAKYTDPHIWLDISNAKAILGIVAEELIKINPSHKDALMKNVEKFTIKLSNLEKDLASKLTAKSTSNALFYHNAWQYFLKQFNLPYLGSIVVESGDDHSHHHLDTSLSVAKLNELSNFIKNKSIKCIFTEPQFDDSAISNLANNMLVKIIQLDPVGNLDTDIAINIYFTMMQNNVNQMSFCK